MRTKVGALAVGLALLLAGCGSDPGEKGGETGDAAPISPAPVTGLASGAPSPQGMTKKPGLNRTEREQTRLQAEAEAQAQAQAQDQVEGSGADPVLGADMSWPQCPKGLGLPEKRTLGAPLPIDAAQYIIVGLTNGPGFVVNPCLAEQVDYVRQQRKQIAAYAVSSFPDDVALATYGDDGPFDASTRLGALRNTGYQQAAYNVASMKRTGFRSPVVWIDVEPVPDFAWSSDREANAAVVEGVARGYTDAGYRIGVYSTAYLWEQVVGGLRLGIPEWRAAGQTSRAEALIRCGPGSQIQGGPAVLGQWVEDNRDMNITCPGIAGQMERWFHQY